MCILVGNVYKDLLKNDKLTDLYLNTLLEPGLAQYINKPTRVTDNSISCIDHLFVWYQDMNSVKLAVLQTGVTNHFSTTLAITASHNQGHVTTGPSATLHTHTYIDYAMLLIYSITLIGPPF